MKIYFVRHGETFWNKCFNPYKRTFMGIPLTNGWNPEVRFEWMYLNKKGHKQSKKTAEKLFELTKNAVIYRSDEDRNESTAKYTEELFNVNAIIDPRLNEYEAGNPDCKETEKEALDRFNECIEDIVKKKNYNNVIIFSHNAVMKEYFLKKNKRFMGSMINGEILETEIIKKKFPEWNLKIKKAYYPDLNIEMDLHSPVV